MHANSLSPPRSPRRAFKVIGALILLGAFIFILPYAKQVIILFVLSLLLSLLLEPVVSFLEARGIKRVWGIVILFGVIVLIVALIIAFLFPIISRELRSLNQTLQSQTPDQFIHKMETFLKKKFPFLRNQTLMENLTSKAQSFLTGMLQKLFTLFFNILSALTTFIIIPFITFFLLKDGRRMKKAFIQIIPNRYFEMSLNIIYKINQQLGRYIRGQLLDAMIVGMLSIIALRILNIPYYVIIGSIAGLANLIPYFGPIVGGVPAVIVGVMHTGTITPAIGVIISFALIQLLDNVLISPLVVAKSVDLHPLVVVVVVLLGGNLLGLLGMLLAVPIASVVKVTVQEIQWGLKNYHL